MSFRFGWPDPRICSQCGHHEREHAWECSECRQHLASSTDASRLRCPRVVVIINLPTVPDPS